MASDLDLSLHLAHLDHRLRPQSGDDARFVRELSESLRLPATVASIDTVDHSLSPRGPGVEAEARRIRYGFFGRVGRTINAAAVVVGHTGDDQIETRLLHLTRGCGLAGLEGMQLDSRVVVPRSPPVRVLRPLLVVDRAATVAFCRARGVIPRVDASNLDPRFGRNRLRAEVVPVLRSLNPRFAESLDRLGRVAASAEEFIDEELTRRIGPLAWDETGRRSLERVAWEALPNALKRAWLRRAASALAEPEFDGLDAESVERAIELASREGESRLIDWPGRLRLRIEGGIVAVELRDETPARLEERPVRDGELICLGRLPRALASLGPPEGYLRATRRDRPCRRNDRWHVDLDVQKIGGAALVVRSRRPGDRLAPEGMMGRKKVQDLLVDAGIPRSERDRVPLVTVGSELVWVVGLRRDRRFLADPSSYDVLCLELRTGEEAG